MASATVEQLVSEINAAGWYVSSVFQRAPRGWGAALRANGDWTSANGEGDTMAEALSAAWHEARRDKPRTEADWKKVREAPKPGKIERRKLINPL